MSRKRLSSEEALERQRSGHRLYYQNRQRQKFIEKQNQDFCERLQLEVGSLGVELDLSPVTRFTTEEDGFLAFLMETETE